MGPLSRLARKTQVVSLIVGGAFLGSPAIAAIYSPDYWTVSGGFSYDTINPSALNVNSDGTENDLPVYSLVSPRMHAERGLFAPSWSHWFEFSYSFGGATSTGFGGTKFQRRLTYASVVPLGVTYWFARTDYMDFGASLGAGFGFSPTLQEFSTSPEGAMGKSTFFSGGLSPIADGRIHGRFWLGKYLGLTLSANLRGYQTSLVGPNNQEIKANLSAYSFLVGVTIAIGGVQGVGRNFVEVMPSRDWSNSTDENAVYLEDSVPDPNSEGEASRMGF